MHIFNISVLYMHSIKKDTLNTWTNVDFIKYALLAIT